MAPQLDRLKPECGRVYADLMSGTKGRNQRPGLRGLLDFARVGDTLVTVKLDRLARSMRELVEVAGELEERKVGLRVLDQPIDTTTPAGRLFYHMLAAFSEFERSILVERTHDGLQAAKARGKVGGRPKALDAAQRLTARHWYSEGVTISEVARRLRTSRATVHRALNALEPWRGEG